MNEYDETIREIRKFNRFYTVSMGFLDSGYLATEYSTAEARVLFEIQMHGKCIQSEIAKTLHLDKSYLSRITKRFHVNGLIEKDKSVEDKRSASITLTKKGTAETERLTALTNDQILGKVNKLSFDECSKLCAAMDVIISILGKGESI